MSKLSNTWKKIREAAGQGKELDDELMFRQLGIDGELLKRLEQQTIDAALDDSKVIVKFVNNSTNEDPKHTHIDDSGMDLRANLDKVMVVGPGERVLVPTGIHFELPESMEIQVRPRSGLAIKHGITVLNTPGTVDRGYNGEIKIILINLSKSNFTINHGDRIAQAVISPVVAGRWSKLIKINSVEPTERGDGGFGSSGIK
jgi:dUTP pyrophosphatase